MEILVFAAYSLQNASKSPQFNMYQNYSSCSIVLIITGHRWYVYQFTSFVDFAYYCVPEVTYQGVKSDLEPS
jgi:hypothetical protein